MTVTKLRKDGENFIRSKCKGSGNSKLRGSATDKSGYNKYNPTAVLPYCSPLTTTSKLCISNSTINGGITTNGELAEALIKWYNKYAEEFSMDANIMAAQAYHESAYIIWNYAVNSTASGISQFIDATIYDIIMRNSRGGMSAADKEAISKNMIDYTYPEKPTHPPFLTDYDLGRQNRPILHQNIIDNPEIMIKAQFAYMKGISTQCDALASCTLFGYSRGPAHIKSSSYSAAIASAKSKGKSYESEGIKYVYKIFKTLYNNFGYRHLNMAIDENGNPVVPFDPFFANPG